MLRFLPVVVLIASSPVLAVPTFVVNSLADEADASPGDGICETSSPGVCTLRAAIQEANTTSNATIDVPAGSFGLSLGPLLIARPMTIVGAGMTKTVVSAGNLFLVIDVFSAGVTLSGMTIRDGSNGGYLGGCIYVGLEQFLYVDSSWITHCSADLGGGIYGAVHLTRSAITDCQATTDGGAFFGHGTFVGGTISGNYAGLLGGGLYLDDTSDLVDSTVDLNTAGSQGGGIFVYINQYPNPSAVVGLHNCTVTQNLTVTQGGGIANTGGDPNPVTFWNSIIAYNSRTASHIKYADDCSGWVASGGNSILQYADPSHCTVSGSVSSVDPLLGPLQDNGGPTLTRAPLTGSPAIDAGNALGCTDDNGAPLTADQRGVHRPLGAACDLGAYERSPCGDVNGDGVVNVSDVFFLIDALFAAGPIPPGLANMNGDSATNVSDVFYLINYLFAGGSPPNCPGT